MIRTTIWLEDVTCLHFFVPASRNEDRLSSTGAETNRGHPKSEVNTWLIILGSIIVHQSVCPSSLMSYLHSPRVFQSLIVLSREPETICLLSALKLTESTSEVWPTKRRVVFPVLRSQRRREWSQDEDKANWPSEDITTSETKWLCPWRIRFGKPWESSSWVNCQTMRVLSRDWRLDVT